VPKGLNKVVNKLNLIGIRIPELTMQDTQGNTINIKQFFGKKAVVLIILKSVA
jgi:peroxiredoxin